MAGSGELVGPADDAALVVVEERAAALRVELNATGAMGELLARRVALLSVRLERSAEHELATVAVGVEAARAEFDQIRWAEIDEHLARLEAGGPAGVEARAALEGSPEGVRRLIELWSQCQENLAAADPAVAEGAAEQVRALLGRESAAGLAARVQAEAARLGRVAESQGDLVRAIAQARHEAGVLASFDPSPEAELARRYEAASERGMYRALRAIADLNRARDRDPLALADGVTGFVAATNPTPPPPPPVAARSVAPPSAPLAPPPAPSIRGLVPTPDLLGSFRAEVLATASPLSKLIIGHSRPDLLPPTPPKKRPDRRELGLTR